MALSFSEKRGHQKVVDENLSTLEGGGLAFAAKRTAQKAMNDSLDKLDAGSELVPDPGNPNPLDEVKPPEPEVAPDLQPPDGYAFDPTKPENYEAILASEELQLKYQDQLDAFFQQRYIDVRNALRELGWSGEKDLSKDGYTLSPVFKYAGPGKNLVAVHYEIKGVIGFFMSDMLTHTVEELAHKIDLGLPAKEPITPKTDQDALTEMVKAILNKGGEVTGKQFPDVFFMFYGGVSAKLSAADGGYIGKNIDTGEQSSSMQTADQAMEWLMSNAKENEAKQYQQNQKLTDLLSGKYDDLQPEAYQVVLKNVFDEINAVDPLKPAVVRYLDKAKAKGLITESAAAAIEELLNQ